MDEGFINSGLVAGEGGDHQSIVVKKGEIGNHFSMAGRCHRHDRRHAGCRERRTILAVGAGITGQADLSGLLEAPDDGHLKSAVQDHGVGHPASLDGILHPRFGFRCAGQLGRHAMVGIVVNGFDCPQMVAVKQDRAIYGIQIPGVGATAVPAVAGKYRGGGKPVDQKCAGPRMDHILAVLNPVSQLYIHLPGIAAFSGLAGHEADQFFFLFDADAAEQAKIVDAVFYDKAGEKQNV